MCVFGRTDAEPSHNNVCVVCCVCCVLCVLCVVCECVCVCADRCGAESQEEGAEGEEEARKAFNKMTDDILRAAGATSEYTRVVSGNAEILRKTSETRLSSGPQAEPFNIEKEMSNILNRQYGASNSVQINGTSPTGQPGK